MDWLRKTVIDWLFPVDAVVTAPDPYLDPVTPSIACPHCGIIHDSLPIPPSAIHVAVRCSCKAAFDVFPKMGWHVRLREKPPHHAARGVTW